MVVAVQGAECRLILRSRDALEQFAVRLKRLKLLTRRVGRPSGLRTPDLQSGDDTDDGEEDEDDLDDGGAAAFADTVAAIRRHRPGCAVEVLIPDCKGDEASLELLESGVDHLFCHAPKGTSVWGALVWGRVLMTRESGRSRCRRRGGGRLAIRASGQPEVDAGNVADLDTRAQVGGRLARVEVELRGKLSLA